MPTLLNWGARNNEAIVASDPRDTARVEPGACFAMYFITLQMAVYEEYFC